MNTLVNRIIELASIQPDKIAVAFKNSSLSYRELVSVAAGMCEALKEHDIADGDHVCFSATSKVETIVIYLAIHMAGAVAVFMDKNATVANMADIYDMSDSSLMLTDKPLNDYSEGRRIISIRDISGEAMDHEQSVSDPEDYRISPDDDDLSELLYTSGTTGIPKGVMLSYRSVFNILNNTIEGIGVEVDDVTLMPLPLNHSFALRVARAVLYKGATLILQNGFTFARAVEDNITRFGCTSMACVPASYEVMRGQMQDLFPVILGDLRYIEFGAGSLSIDQRRTITNLLPRVAIYNTWGSSETGGAIFCNVSEVAGDERYIGALGKPLAGHVQVRVIDEDGHDIESSQENPGRMALKGDMLMTGYYKNEAETRKTLHDGWLYTGDVVYVSDGYIYMLGRADNIINVGGEKVSPIEVENVAGQLPAIRECACIGVQDPDGILGQVPLLYVVSVSDVTEDDIRCFLADKLERYKIPTVYRFIDSIPRNRMQKIDYKELKNRYEAGSAVDDMNETIRTIMSRRSVRRFTDEDIPRTKLDMMLKCGYNAPSGHNMQSWRFTVLTERNDIEKLRSASEVTARENNVHFYGFDNPKVLVLISNDKRNPDGCQDASCAAENIMLAATSYGIGSVWLNPLMTLRSKSPVRELLDAYGIPDNHVVWAMIALGYPVAQPPTLKKKDNVVIYV